VPIPGRRQGSGGDRRGVLLLSLILLVWNVCASAERLVSAVFFPAPAANEGFPVAFASGSETDSLSPESPRSGPLTIRQKYLLGKRVDINKASMSELSELPGISDTVAASMVEERDRLGGFRSPEDLLGVKGIKAKRLRKILPFLSGMHNN
jgi:competence ComEA-like helix-hairpin-helix protein